MEASKPAWWLANYGMKGNMANVASKLAEFAANAVEDIVDIAAELLPVALPVLGIAIAVFFGVKFIKKVMR